MSANKKRSIPILIILGIVLLLSSNVYAIGVTPAGTIIQFEPGLKKTIKVNIINSEQQGLVTKVSVQGELKDYIKLRETILKFSENDSTKTLTFNVELPTTLKPGINQAEIIIEEQATQPAGISAFTAVTTQVLVQVPYPGKYVEIDGMEISKGEFVIGVTNLGSQNLKNVFAKIEIRNSNGQKVGELETQKTSLPTTRREILKSNWESKKVGKYLSIVTINFDGEQKKLEKEFQILTAAAVKELEKVEKLKFKGIIITTILILTILTITLFLIRRKFNKLKK